MSILARVLPDATTAAALPPEVAASYLLEVMNVQADHHEGSASQRSPAMALQPKAFHVGNVLREVLQHYGVDWYHPAGLVFAEAWTWLEHQCFLLPQPTGDAGWFILSRRGRECRSPDMPLRLAAVRMLRTENLHPAIAGLVVPSFAAAKYDVAVFEAFRALEVAVRRKAGFVDGKIGVKLMQDAFHPEHGPLAEPRQDSGERYSRQHLFAGAIGSFKNPSSHREVNYANPAEAAEAIGLASLLLRMLDRAPSAPNP